MMSRILIIDDDPFNLKMADMALKKKYEIVGASSGEEGLEKMKSDMFDLILLDILMPGMDGYEVITCIRGISGYEFVPVLFLTAETGEELNDKAYAAGALEVIKKPFKIAELLQTVEKYLS